jgi:hypothetical protein
MGVIVVVTGLELTMDFSLMGINHMEAMPSIIAALPILF